MHQSIPPAPSPPPRATAGHLPALSVPGVGHLQILHCPGAGHLPTPGPLPSFWHARGFPLEYNYKEGFTGKKADWLVCKVQEYIVEGCKGMFSILHVCCISLLLIKPELRSEIGAVTVNQISVDIIWRTSFHIYKTIHNIQHYIALLILMSIILYQY